MNRASVLARMTVQVEVPAESREDISAHVFWKQGTTAMFDIQIVNLDAVSCRHMMPEKDLSKGENGNKDL